MAMTSDASFKATYAYQSWADLVRRENVDLDSFYSHGWSVLWIAVRSKG